MLFETRSARVAPVDALDALRATVPVPLALLERALLLQPHSLAGELSRLQRLCPNRVSACWRRVFACRRRSCVSVSVLWRSEGSMRRA